MKLVEIEHERCNEPDKTVYYLAPEHLTVEEIKRAVAEAKRLYLLAFEKQTSSAPLPARPNYDNLPDATTLKEAKQRMAEYDRLVKERNSLIQETSESFDACLKRAGFISLHEWPDKIECVADWGHNHGKKFSY